MDTSVGQRSRKGNKNRRDSILEDKKWDPILKWLLSCENDQEKLVNEISEHAKDFIKFWPKLRSDTDETYQLLIAQDENVYNQKVQLSEYEDRIAELQSKLQEQEPLTEDEKDRQITELQASLDDLQRTCDEYQSAGAKYQNETGDLVAQLRVLKDVIAERPQANLGMSRESTPSENRHRPKPILPDPAKFDQPVGQQSGNASAYRIWKEEMKRKLETDFSTDSETAKFNYMLTRLAGETGIAMSAFMQSTDEATKVNDVDSLFKQLNERYESHFAKLNARNAYRTFRQYEKPFEEFLSKFKTLAADANISEEEQLLDFKTKLSSHLREITLTVNPTSLGTMIAEIRQVAYNMEDLMKVKRNQVKRTTTSPAVVTTSTSSTNTTTQASTPTTKASNHDWLADQKCFNCQKLGHLSRNCPHPKKEALKELPSTKSP